MIRASTLRNRLAIIGVGKWGSKIAKTVSASRSLEWAAAVSSKHVGELEAIAPFDGILVRDFRQLSDHADQLDGVVIATPPQGRDKIIDYFLDLGIPVFSEKPMSIELHHTKRLVEKARHCGVDLVEDFVHLFSWAYLEIRDRVDPANPLEIESCGGGIGPYRDYSPLYDYGPHDLAMTLQFFRCQPETIDVRPFDQVSANRFSVKVELGFGQLGSALLKFGNSFQEKQRIFTCRNGETEWCYDDSSDEKLFHNGEAVNPGGPLMKYSTIELALQCFTGNIPVYSAQDMLDLSVNVAELLDRINRRLSAVCSA